jgi:hypothetical protein
VKLNKKQHRRELPDPEVMAGGAKVTWMRLVDRACDERLDRRGVDQALHDRAGVGRVALQPRVADVVAVAGAVK